MFGNERSIIDHVESILCIEQVCIDLTMVCDGVNDCSDGSDESGAVCAGYSCSLNDQFPCSVIHKCLEQSLVCDGVWNCPFGADENDTLCEFIHQTIHSF